MITPVSVCLTRLICLICFCLFRFSFRINRSSSHSRNQRQNPTMKGFLGLVLLLVLIGFVVGKSRVTSPFQVRSVVVRKQNNKRKPTRNYIHTHTHATIHTHAHTHAHTSNNLLRFTGDL